MKSITTDHLIFSDRLHNLLIRSHFLVAITYDVEWLIKSEQFNLSRSLRSPPLMMYPNASKMKNHEEFILALKNSSS